MITLIVVDNPKAWRIQIPSVQVVSARSYLTDHAFSGARGVRVFNLCRSYRYQTSGYYVSLLAEARGHRPVPRVQTVQDIQSTAMLRMVSDDLDQQIQRTLSRVTSPEFVLSVYFGKNIAKHYDRLSLQLFNLFPVPLMRVEFTHNDDRWHLRRMRPIAAAEIPEHHFAFVIETAEHYFTRPKPARSRTVAPYSLGILVNPEETSQPSNKRAISRFVKAAHACGFDVDILGKEHYGRLNEFDALFIRETTAVNHHTYRFASQAQALGLVVIDDPESILRCSNKVYLAERLARQGIRSPNTMIVHRDNLRRVGAFVGFPCVLKQPDSSFSKGVIRVAAQEEFVKEALKLLESSSLVVAQSFIPTEFDWRVGILDGQVLFVCRYHMARDHWQIVHRANGESTYGKVDSLPVSEAPSAVLKAATQAARLFGNGLYGVDLKQVNNKVYVIEVNDNPNIDAGFEDTILGDQLYRRIMQVFLHRVELRKGTNLLVGHSSTGKDPGASANQGPQLDLDFPPLRQQRQPTEPDPFQSASPSLASPIWRIETDPKPPTPS